MVFVGGCATPATNTYDYRASELVRVENEVTIQREFETVWSDLVRQLAKGFYVVNNIEKESRLINVSFTSSTPEDYLNCGVMKRTFQRGKETETIEYNVAADSTYRYGRGKDPTGVNAIVGTVERKTSLDGRMNIYVAPSDIGTQVSVNVRYVLTMNTSGVENAIGIYDQVVASQPIPPGSITHSFNTNQPNQNAEGISCFSKGVLENEVLMMAKAE
jgi:hypothetical protein